MAISKAACSACSPPVRENFIPQPSNPLNRATVLVSDSRRRQIT